MNPTVHLDATIPSFYYEDRVGTVIQAWRQITAEFGDEARSHYDCFVSDETLCELQETSYPEEKRERCFSLVAGLPRLTVTPEVIDLAAFYVGATWYRIQYLLTWNCKHLANANKFEHVQILNTRRRLVSPAIVTPAQLLEIEA